MDSIETTLAEAGRLREGDTGESEALRDLVMARTSRVAKRRRVLLPALSLGGALVVVGTGAAIATQWAPWSDVPNADLVIARDWTDVDGNSLGSCESRLAAGALPADALSAARDDLAALDTDSLAPDPGVVSALLAAVGRPDRVGHLIPGADADDFDTNASGPLWDGNWWSDARILQEGLVRTAFMGMADDLAGRFPALNTADSFITSKIQTQCTTDPAGFWQE